ncbi:MAG TPA: carboxypeptidase-like regulatory domain-containing protein [Longimicrobiales bacterium]
MVFRLTKALIFLLVTCPQLFPQGVRGLVVDKQNGVPVLGAFVTLIDEYSYQRAAALTDSTGRFFLRAPKPGSYVLRAERIGYETITSAPLQLTRDTIFIRFEVPTVAIPIDSIDVRGADRGCRKRADASGVYQLWNALSTALRITAWSQESDSMQYSLFRYMRDIERTTGLLMAENRIFHTKTSALSFSSLAPEELEAGFLQADASERTLWGPDALLLLSNEFQDMHCFSLVRDRKANAIGMSFEPLKNSKDVVDVKGVLWADARNAELRRLTFEYTNLPRHLAVVGSSGEVEFRKLPSGHWIVQKWWIRMPLFGGRNTSRGYFYLYLLGTREEGGHVVSVDGVPSHPMTAGVIEGQVVDSATQQPISDATVFVSTTPHEAKTDSLGRYRITGLSPGKHQIAVNTPTLVELNLPIQLHERTVSPQRPVQLNLTSPTYASMYRSLCAAEDPDVGGSLIFGIVRDSASGVPLYDAEMKAQWEGASLNNEAISKRWRTRQTRTDGRYYLCWMPENSDVEVTARSRRNLARANVHLMGAAKLRQDFMIPRR